MADEAIDVLMYVSDASGPLSADSTTTMLESGNLSTAAIDKAMRLGFKPGYFCELREFSFSAGIAPDPGAKQLAELQKRLGDAGSQPETAAIFNRLKQSTEKAATESTRNKSVDIQPAEFERQMDSMSTKLFSSLVKSEVFTRISVIKRKAVGTSNSGEAYLRLDFDDVLLVSLDWKDNDHMMIESGSFVYRKLAMRYRPQNPDGSLGAIVPASWQMKSA